MRLRTQLVLFASGLSLAFTMILVVSEVLFRTTILPELEHYLDHKAETTVRALALFLDVPLAANDPSRAEVLIRPYLEDPDLIFVEIQRQDGSAFATMGRPNPQVKRQGPSAKARRMGDMAVAWGAVELESLRLGHVQVAYRSKTVTRLLAYLENMTLLVSALFLLATLASFRYAAWFVHPIVAMMKFSRDVAAGNFSQKVDISTHGELAHLASDLNCMASAIHQREADLFEKKQALQASIEELRHTRDELLESTRLASVGELAGQTAHEVLNPITSMRARLELLMESEADTTHENLGTLKTIIDAWRQSYASGGVEGLAQSLAEHVDVAGQKTAIEEDLDVLDALERYLRDRSLQLSDHHRFLFREIDRITHIVESMRSMTRKQASYQHLPLSQALSEAADIIQDQLIKRSIALHIDCPGNPVVLADRFELIQVLTNVLRNGMLAIEEGRGRTGGSLRIRCETQGHYVHVDVIDNGTGISEENISRLFENKFTTRSAKNGTGLGLIISRRLVRGFGGDLALQESKPNQGCTFRIKLPMATSIYGESQGETYAVRN